MMAMTPQNPAELDARRRVEHQDWRPRNCVWELTLACNLRCLHCGSRAGHVRPRELSTAECLDIVHQLAELGAELVTLSGGEPTLRRDWDVIAHEAASVGLWVNMVTNGVYRDADAAADIARRARAAGLCNVAVSVDGPEAIHDAIRGEGTFARALQGVAAFRAVGLPVTLMTTVSRRNLHALDEVLRTALACGAEGWRLQLAKPMGAMVQSRQDILQPEDLLYLLPTLARMKPSARAQGLTLTVGDSLGYYGPPDEVLRGRGWRGRAECWQGCQAGLQAIGIQADGSVKGCLSMQAYAHGTAPDAFVEGQLRDERLADIWFRAGAFAYNRDFDAETLTGACAACRYGRKCRGGARCVSSAVAGTLTEDPYCYTALVEARATASPAAGRRPLAAAVLAASIAGTACDEGADPAVVEDTDMARRDAAPRQDAGSMDARATDARVADALSPPNDAWLPDARALDAATPHDARPGDAATPPADAARPPADATVPPADAARPPTDARVPDALGPDAAIDCTAVCCACEYGVLPPDVWETCCAPCANVCCECDYGAPPPPQCCP